MGQARPIYGPSQSTIWARTCLGQEPFSEQYPEKFDEMIEAWNQYQKENGVIIPESVMGF